MYLVYRQLVPGTRYCCCTSFVIISHTAGDPQSLFMLVRRIVYAALGSAVARLRAASLISIGRTRFYSTRSPPPSLFSSRGRQTAVAIRSNNSGSRCFSGELFSRARMSSSASTAADTPAAVWDPAAGVWVGDKAAGHEGDLPSPLWIFG